jgi:hypothetical protein
MTTEEDMRLLVDDAAEVIMTYALSDEFSWDRDCEILAPIIACATKLKAILADREGAQA